MKIRIGFVSNSSSSSFLFVTSKKAHEQVLSTLKPHFAWVVARVIAPYDPNAHSGRWRADGFEEPMGYYKSDYYGNDEWDDLNNEWKRLMRSSPIEALSIGIDGDDFPFPPEQVPDSVIEDGVWEIVSHYEEMIKDRGLHFYKHEERT